MQLNFINIYYIKPNKMKKQIFIKVRTIENGKKKATIIEYQPKFSDVLKKVEDFVKISDSSEVCQITDEKSNKTISTQREYEELPSQYQNGEKIKLYATKLSRNSTTESEKTNEDQLEKIKNNLQDLVHTNLKNLENSLVETIFESIKIPLNESLIKKPKQSEITHYGIKCDNCEKENIKGIRYKCMNCENYNLCSECESLNKHNPNHILIKIRKNIENEDELNLKIKNINLKYEDIQNFTAEVVSKDFEEYNGNKKPDKLVFYVSLKNYGEKILEKGWSFKCLTEDSELEGCDYHDEKNDLKTNESLEIKLFVDDLQDQLRFYENYSIYYELFDKNNVFLWKAKFNIEIPRSMKDHSIDCY